MKKTIVTRIELIRLIGEDAVEELEVDGFEYQRVRGVRMLDLRDIPEIYLQEGDSEELDDEEEEDDEY